MNNLEIATLDVSFCLRKDFTKNIIASLVDKRLSINLISEKGTGKTRLLEDIRKCNLPGICIVNINLKSYDNNYDGLLKEIHRQLELSEEVPGHLYQLFEGLETQPIYLVFLDNYDALLDNPKIDGKFDVNFFDDLNAIKNRDNVSLLCITCRPHNTLPVFIEGESFRNSWLTLEKIYIPSLTRVQLMDELERQLGDKWKGLNHDDKESLLACIRNKKFPFRRLCFLTGKIKTQTYEEAEHKFKKRLKKWMKEFKKGEKYALDKKLHGIKSSTEGAVIASGINKWRIPIISDISKFIKNKLGG